MVVIDDRTKEFETKQELEEKAQAQANKVEKLYQILQLPPDTFSHFIKESDATLNEATVTRHTAPLSYTRLVTFPIV